MNTDIVNSSAARANDPAVVVVSCDAYADLWPAFFTAFWRFWPSCRYPVYLVANHRQYEDARVTTIRLGADASWSTNVLNALQRVPASRVLMMLEDLIIRQPVSAERLARVLEWAAASGADYVKLRRQEPWLEPVNGLVGRISPHSPYRVSTVCSLWRKAALKAALRAGESAWEFEIQGSARMRSEDGFYCVRRECLPVMNCVIRGRWSRSALRRAGQMNLPLDRGRPVMGRLDSVRYAARVAAARASVLLPPPARLGLRQLMQGRTG